MKKIIALLFLLITVTIGSSQPRIPLVVVNTNTSPVPTMLVIPINARVTLTWNYTNSLNNVDFQVFCSTNMKTFKLLKDMGTNMCASWVYPLTNFPPQHFYYVKADLFTNVISLGWVPNSTGSNLDLTKGYLLSQGITSGTYTQNYNAGTNTSITIPINPQSDNYFVVSAYDAVSNKSAPSTELFVPAKPSNIGVLGIKSKLSVTFSNLVVPVPNLVAWWNLKDGKGLVAKDSSLNNNGGSLKNNVAWLTNGVLFSGQNYIDIINNTSLSLSTNFSLFVWFSIPSPAISGFQDFIGKANGVGNESYDFGLIGINGTSHLTFVINGTSFAANSNTSISSGTTHLGVITYNGTNYSYYLDSILDGSFISQTRLMQSTADVTLGGRLTAGFNDYYIGSMYQAGICTNCLTPAQITNLFQLGWGYK